MKLTATEAEEFLTLPEDAVVQLTVTEITDRLVTGQNGKSDWTSLNFKFKILELPDYLGDEFDALIGSTMFGSVGANLTTHPDNKLRQWAEALLDMPIEKGFAFDTEMLVGRKARGVVGNYTKRDSTQVQHKIKGLLPLVPVGVAATPAPAATSSFFSDEPPF